MYYFETFDDALNFLIEKGGYYEDSFRKKENEDAPTYRARVFRIASRVYECMGNYPKEIYAYLKKHPEKRQYTMEELNTLTYKELSVLRTSLGISKRRGKKVVKETTAGETYERGLNYVRGTSTTQLAASAIVSATEELEDSKEESILSEEEIAFMYGEDMPNLETLRSQGIVPEFPTEYEERIKFDLDTTLRKKKK